MAKDEKPTAPTNERALTRPQVLSLIAAQILSRNEQWVKDGLYSPEGVAVGDQIYPALRLANEIVERAENLHRAGKLGWNRS